MRCIDCFYFVRHGGQINPILGRCRRLPPLHKSSSSYVNKDDFPLVTEDLWCGEYKSKVIVAEKLRLVRED